jgi:coproporphyrinogen III oxidase
MHSACAFHIILLCFVNPIISLYKICEIYKFLKRFSEFFTLCDRHFVLCHRIARRAVGMNTLGYDNL